MFKVFWLAAGYIVLRGWCQNPNTSRNARQSSFAQTNSISPNKTHDENFYKKDNRLILCFEVDDTGCGVNLTLLETNLLT